MAGCIVFFVDQWICFVENAGNNLVPPMNKSSYNYYFIFSLSPFYFPVCVNNILERDNEEETPIKWGKKRLKIFP